MVAVGRQVIAKNGEQFTAADVAVQADGKTVVVGSSRRFVTGERRFATARFNVNGTLDQGFGVGGVALTQLSDQDDSFATAVAIAPDGKIVVVGGAHISAGFNEIELAAARYNSDGSLDNTFDGNGVLSRDLSAQGTPTDVRDVAVRPDGQIVIVGGASHGFTVNHDAFVAYYGVTGAFRGVTRVDFGDHDDAVAVKLDSTGRVFLAGTKLDVPVESTALARLTTFELPPELGGPGTAATVDFTTIFELPGRTDTLVEDLFLRADGKIVVAGETLATDGRHDLFVARFTAAGALDTTFNGGSGFRITDLGGDDIAGGIIPTPAGGGGGFIVSGRSGTGTMVAVKYTDDGVPDTTFGNAGIARVSGFTLLDTHAGDRPFFAAPRIAPGPGRRVAISGGANGATARLLLNGAREVNAFALDPIAGEGTTNTGTLFVGRTERLPFPTRVFFSVGGTATFSSTRGGTRDYSMSGFVFPTLIGGTGFVDIPANQTSVTLTFTTFNDALREPTESAIFGIVANSVYEISSPSSGTINIQDDDTPNFSVGTTTVALPDKQVGVGQELQAAVTWTVPTGGWRQLSTIQLRLRDRKDGDALAILTFDEATNSFSVESTPNSAGAGNNPVSLILGKCTFQAAGPTAPTVTILFTFVFDAAAANTRYAVDVAATNDTGALSGFAQIGELHVHKKPKKDGLALPL